MSVPEPSDNRFRQRGTVSPARAQPHRRSLASGAMMRARTGLQPRVLPGALNETDLSRAYRETALSLVERIVSVEMNVSIDALHARTRSVAMVSFARQVAMYLAHTIFKLTQSDVGQMLGRDRTTVKHACARVEDRRDDAGFDARLIAMEAICEAALSGMHLFAVQGAAVSERVLVEIGARPNEAEDRR